MDGTAGVHRVVEIQRMTHAGIEQRRLWRRQAGTPQQHTAFLTPAPPGDHRKELIDPRRAAAAEHAAKGVEDVATGGFDGARRQIHIAGAANVLGERPSGVIGHGLLTRDFDVPILRYPDRPGPDSFEWPAGASTDASIVRGAGSRVAGHRPAQRSARLRRA